MSGSIAQPSASLTIPGFALVALIYSSSKTLVYRAVAQESGQSVVIKLLQGEFPRFQDLVQLQNEYAIAKSLNHPGIVQALELKALDRGYALILEDFGGVSLTQYVEQQSLSVSDVLQIGRDLAAILHELSRHRIIHKDIKPCNILIHPQSKQVKLIDFSIASRLPRETQRIQSPASLAGTLAYLAPEQTGRMNRTIDYRTDFYALGVTLYQLLSGQLPFISDDSLSLIHCHMTQHPDPVHQVNPQVPPMVSTIIAKLMAKNAEERYQSALGLKYDLDQCWSTWQESRDVPHFVSGTKDVSDRFLIPEKLYGRDAEVKALLAAFHRVAHGASELILVAGISGIGKTVVINEIHRPIVQQRGYFIRGKFEQFKRNIPFSALVQAGQDLVRQLLSESDAELKRWTQKILDALGARAQVIIDLIPELEHVLGPQPSVLELSGPTAENRLNHLFQKFIQVFASADHPLAICVDDLQWADFASLNLMRSLVTQSQTQHLLLLGAYRDTEVSPTHPLTLMLNALEDWSPESQSVSLGPLGESAIDQLVADTLLCSVTAAQSLSQLIFQKTQGNPFFSTQFFYGLYQDGHIVFNPDQGGWECALTEVRRAALTEDVVQFMVGRLQLLPTRTRDALKMAACIGNSFDLKTLAVVCTCSQADIAADLWQVVQDGLIIPENETYRFFQ
ncbi:MAG: serine/threonine-protein kinase PknK, partial [Cyanobacteria bacterium P01_F01_bin.42]